MTKKTLYIVLILALLALLVSTRDAFGQKVKPSLLSSISQMPTAPSMFFSKVVVYLQEGGVFTGLLVGVENDLLVVRSGGRDKNIHLSNLAKVSIEREEKMGRDLFYGLILGTYLGNQIFNRAENQPIAYMKDIDLGWEFLLQNVIFAAVGGGFGYLLGLVFEKEEKVFDFNGSDKKRQAKWRQFIRYIMGDRVSKRVHLSIQTGHVFTDLQRKYTDLLKNAGYYMGRSYDFEPASDFNLLRKLQITISIKPEIEVGIALISVGEPSIYGVKWEIGSLVNQSLNTTGCYAIGIYKPFLTKMPKRIAWNIGAGVGAAKVDFCLEDIFHSGYPSYTSVITPHNISKNYFSAVVFTELNFYIYNTLSLGLIADYVYVPPEDVPEIPELGIPNQKLRFGNGSVGLTFGLHF